MNDQLRLSDADRDQAAAALGDHYAEGRITTEEHAERLDRIWAARTRGDLAPVFRDLPTPGRTPAYWTGRRAGFRPPIVPVLVVLLVLTVLTHVPFLLLGVLALVFVASRRRRHWEGAQGTPPRW